MNANKSYTTAKRRLFIKFSRVYKHTAAEAARQYLIN